MQLHDLKPAPGATHRSKRVGRGIGSGNGKTAGKGYKGQKARSGATPRLGFEGGQTPLYRRLPQKPGFRSLTKKNYVLVSVGELDAFDAGTVVTPELLVEEGFAKKIKDGVKVLGDGEITKALTVKANKFSTSAAEKITAAGGTVEVI
ncbi:MAG: 50S ribosomal protein L15 [Abditibacteriota bacterium]|nr:50S ribosomal protein L15 [Abditibacteriota bacterium]